MTKEQRSEQSLRVMLLDEDEERGATLRTALTKAGHSVVAHANVHAGNLLSAVDAFAPDLIIIDTDSPDRDTLEHLCVISESQPRPIVMFSENRESATIREATRAGVSAYVVDGLNPNRIQPVIDAAVARFEQLQALRDELADTQTKLTERKTIEKAKGLVMARKSVNEEQAYRMLRKIAMDRNIKLVEVAEEIIRSAAIL